MDARRFYEIIFNALRDAAIMAETWGIGVCALMQFDAEPFVGLFAKDSTEVVRLGSQYMRGYV